MTNQLELGKNFNFELFKQARGKAWATVEKFAEDIPVGINEPDAASLLAKKLADAGAKKFWHKCVVRFGENTSKGYKDDLDPNSVLKEEDIFLVDIGPVFQSHEADVGKTFVKGQNEKFLKISEDVKKIFDHSASIWRETSCSGMKLYQHAAEFAESLGWIMNPSYVVGHRLGAFPHLLYDKRRLPDLEDTPESYFWILEMQISNKEKTFGAFYEDWLA